MEPGDFLILLKGTLTSFYKFQSVPLRLSVKCAVGKLESS